MKLKSTYKYINIKYNSIETTWFCARSYVIRNIIDKEGIKLMFCHVKIHSTFVCSLRTGVTVTFRSTQYCQCGFVVIVQKCIKIYVYFVAGSAVGRSSRTDGRTVPHK